MKLPNILNSSVAMRTTVLVLVIITLIMGIGGMWQVFHVRNEVGAEMQRQANRSMDGVVKVIDNRISNVETAVITAAAYADIFAYSDVTADSLLERLIRSNKDISAVTLLYKADFFPQHGRYYAPTISRNALTKELEFDEIGGPENEFCYLETDSNWIYTNLKDEGYWCLPYVDSMSTKRAMVTYSVPLHDGRGETYAVLCADIDLNWVQQIVEEAKPYSYSQVSVLSRDAQYICHPDSSCILSVNALNLAKEQGDSKELDITERMLRFERGSDTLESQFFNTKKNTDDEVENGKQIIYYAPVERVQWSICFSIPESKIMEYPNQLGANIVIMLIVLLVFISCTLYFVMRAQLWPMKMLAMSTQDIAKGNFDVELPAIKTKDEIRNLRDAFDNMRHSLTKYISDLQNATASKTRIESELKVASGIQMAMLPKKYPPYPERDDIDIYGLLTPAKEVGGDLYDFYIRDEKLIFCIGDVSGKGVPASLVMAVTKALFRTISAHEAAPDRIMTAINETISENNESNMFVTLFIGVLDLPTGRMRFCNAGHNSPLLIGQSVAMLPVENNIPVGIMKDWKFTLQHTVIDPQTTMLLYTDGLTEAENIEHSMFGEERLMRLAVQFRQDGSSKAETVIRKISDAVHDFVGKAEQSDDLTMLAVKYTKKQYDVRLQKNFTTESDVKNVPQLSAFVEQVCEELGFDMSETMQINLAIEEAVVNVMSYAYPDGRKGSINVEAQANDVRLKFTITDSGVPFDPTAKEKVDTNMSLDDRPIGGLGIHLVRQLMDSINYERVDNMNVLTLRKKLKA